MPLAVRNPHELILMVWDWQDDHMGMARGYNGTASTLLEDLLFGIQPTDPSVSGSAWRRCWRWPGSLRMSRPDAQLAPTRLVVLRCE